jgi:hypothetical protein
MKKIINDPKDPIFVTASSGGRKVVLRRCVTRKRDGRLEIRTKGRQNGKDCKGSAVDVPYYPLGPGVAKTP